MYSTQQSMCVPLAISAYLSVVLVSDDFPGLGFTVHLKMNITATLYIEFKLVLQQLLTLH